METEFWGRAIAEVKKTSSDFLFIAEIYGEFEWQLQQLGFDFTYDMRCFTTNWQDVILPPPNSSLRGRVGFRAQTRSFYRKS